MCSIPHMCPKIAGIPLLSNKDYGFFEVAGNWFPDFASNVVCVASVCVCACVCVGCACAYVWGV